jgi:hypothetical protein
MTEPAAAEVDFSEAELTGEESVAPVVEAPAPEPAKEEEAVVTPAEPAAAPPPVKEETPKEPKTVPLAALHEERKARQKLASEVAVLQARIAADPVKDPASMILEDPEGAVGVLKQQIEDLRSEMLRRDMERDITAAVPDFFEKAPQMEELLLGEGFSEEAIRNMIGSTGKEAPKLFKMLGKLVDTPDTAAIRAQVTAELTPQITAEITKQLMAKFNVVPSATDISKLPGAAPTGKVEINSESEYAKLTPEQQQKWLAGEI